jgi:hypothetical protein
MIMEHSIIISALNNASGYPMGDNIETELGYKKTEIGSLLEKLLKDDKYQIKDQEKQMIVRSLEVCLKYIDAWEFPAVFEHEKTEVEKFYTKFIKS